MTSRIHKKEIMVQARALGWKGKSYRKAKRFDRKLTRQAKEEKK